MRPNEPVHHEASLSHDVYQRLKEYILNDVDRPSDRIRIGQLSTHFGVSITPIREALIRLQAEYIVDASPGRGFFFKEFIPNEQIKTYELLYFILKYSLESGKGKALPLLPKRSASVRRVNRGPLAAAIAREELYSCIVTSSGNEQAIVLARNLSERTRSSRILFLEHHEAGTTAADELHRLEAAVRASEYQAALEMLRDQFGAKVKSMHMLADERRQRIYEAYPLLRPSSIQQLRS